MANKLQIKRGLVAGIPTGSAGEPLFTTDTNDLYIGTGSANIRFQKYIASGATTQILLGDGSLYSFPLAISSPTNGQYLTFNGTSWVNTTLSGTGITTLNTLTATTQTFATGTSGTDFNISSATSTHTFNLPTASGTNRGALSSADWTNFTAAYNDKINSAAVTGTTTKTLTLTQQDGGTITASWTDIDTSGITSLNGLTAATQTFANDTNVTITSATSTHTIGWSGTLAISRGGTGASTAIAAFDNLSPLTTLGDTIFHNGTDNVRLAGNTTTAKQYLSQTGNGTVSAAPSWATITGSDITGAALTKTDDTNVTLTLGGTPTTALLRAASLTLGWTGQLAVGRGGTGASTLTGVLLGNGTSAFTAITGTASQYLRRNSGNTAYEFGAIGGGDVTGAALTKTDDTNVTLTLGGTPTTALLRAASITVGWSGTLAVSRGGTGLSALGTANQLLRVNAGATALEYFTPSYLTAAITSLNGLTAATQTFAVGTSGTDFAISSTTSTHTFNLPTASATNRGALSSADWTTFNNKQNALTNPVTGTGTINYIPKFTATGSTIGDSDLRTDANNNLGLGVTPSAWGSNFKVLQSGNVTNGVSGSIAFFNTSANGVVLYSNAYNDNTNDVYVYTASAGKYAIENNAFKWFQAAQGTAGTAISFTQAMTLSANGRLLLGTTNEDTQLLQVNGTALFTANVTGSGNVVTIKNTNTTTSATPALALDTAGTGADQPVDIRFGSTNPKGLRIYASNAVLATSPGGAGFQMYSNTSTNFPGQMYFDSGANNSAAIIFRTAITSGNITERMRIDAAGNVGISITPSAWGSSWRAIQVANGMSLWSATGDNAYYSRNVFYDGTNRKYIFTGAATEYVQSTQHLWNIAASGTAGANITFTTAMTLNASGNLGIGTSSPTAYTGYATLALNGSNGGAIEFKKGDIQQSRITNAGDKVLQFVTDDVERMRITATGVVDISNTARVQGITAPTSGEGLEFQYASGQGEILAYNRTGAAYTAFRLRATTLKLYGGGGAGGLDIAATGAATFSSSVTATNFYSTGASNFATSSGNVGIGTSSPAVKLDVVGEIRSTSTSGYAALVSSSALGFSILADTHTSGAMTIWTDGSEKARIKSTGQLQLNNYQSTTSFSGTVVGYLAFDASGNILTTASAGGGGVTGSGNTNYISKWTSSSALGDSLLQEGTNAIGLSVTPSAWNSNTKAIQIGDKGSLFYLGSSPFYTALRHNAFYNASANDVYLTTDFASDYYQSAGQHIWRNAPSGTAGTNFTFTQAMTLDANGKLMIGTTTSGRKLTVFDSTIDNHILIAGTAPSVAMTDTVTSATYQAKFGLATASNNFATGSVAGDFVISCQTGAIIWALNSVQKMQLKTTSQLQLHAYTSSSSFSGTAAGYLAFDSSGNVITVAVPSSGGITTLNTLTAATQTFAVGTSGTDFNISSATSTHTFNIPDASGSARGLVTTGTQTFAGAKTFSTGITNSRVDPRSITTTSTATLTPDVSVDDVFTVTAQAATITLANPTGTPVEGQKIIVRIKDNGTARSILYGTQYRGSTDLALPTTTTISRTIYLGFIYNSTDTKWDLLAKLDNFA